MTTGHPGTAEVTSPSFGPGYRRRSLDRMAAEGVDLLVIGGGITGCGVAREAALEGLRVALVEKEDFAFGTSSRSSKIIHGGVRYLEYGHFLLVRESARERKVLRRIAPHLVHRLPFLYPVFDSDSLLKIRAGLTVFDWLAGAEESEKHETLGPDEVRRRLPGLRERLKGAVAYPEFITDDARLTLENAIAAAREGAWVANHVEVGEILEEEGRVVGALVEDRIDGASYEVRARVVVNATGPWVETFLRRSELPVEYPIAPSKGIHLLFDAARLPIQGATFLKARNGRRGLAMRRQDTVYVGTSDDEYHGSLDRPRATREEARELLSLVQDSFPDQGLTLDDVRAVWAGIRPLIREGGKTTRDMSREDRIWTGPPGLVSVAGGKLTTYRRMAERVLEEVARELDRDLPGSDLSAGTPLPGAPHEAGGIQAFRAERAARLARAGVAPRTVERLLWLYGRQIDDLLALGDSDPAWLDPLADGAPALRGEVRHAVDQEMALTLIDFMDRRSALLLFAPDVGMDAAAEACRIMARRLDWSRLRADAELARYQAWLAEHRLPAPGASEPSE